MSDPRRQVRGQTRLLRAAETRPERAGRLRSTHHLGRLAFRASRWIAFYARNKIDVLAEIDGEPEDDVLVAERPEWAALASAMGAGAYQPHTVFRLKNVSRVGPIINDARDKNGEPTAWTQNQRYTTIDKLRAAMLTSEL